MVLLAAIVLIVVVLAAAVFAVGSDLFRRPAGERLSGLKDWQGLIGAVLGFMGAAGVLVLSTQFDADQARQQSVEKAHTIGLALAYEAESLSNGLAGMVAIINIIEAQPPDQDWAYACTEFVKVLAKTVAGEKPVWTAALGEMVAFGDENLQLFVRYHLYYDELVGLATEPDPRLCQRDGKNEIGRYRERLESTIGLYRDIAAVYGTTYVEPAPAGPAADAAPVETRPAEPAAN